MNPPPLLVLAAAKAHAEAGRKLVQRRHGQIKAAARQRTEALHALLKLETGRA